MEHSNTDSNTDTDPDEERWRAFVNDLESFPSPRRPSADLNRTIVPEYTGWNTIGIPQSWAEYTWSWITKLDQRTVRCLFLKAAGESPLLAELYSGGGGEGKGPMKRLVGVVGPIPKMMLVEMVVRHPNLMAGVLDRQDRLRVSVALCDRMFLSFWVSLSEYG